CARRAAEGRAPRACGLELVDEADVNAADVAAVDVVCGGKRLGQTRGAGRTEAGVRFVADLVDDRIQHGVLEDIVVGGEAPAVGVLVVASLRHDAPVQAAQAQLLGDLVLG